MYFCAMISRVIFVLYISVLLFACGNSSVADNKPKKDSVVPKKKTVSKNKPGIVYTTQLYKGTDNAYSDAVGRMGDTIFYSSYKGKIEYSDTLRITRKFLFDLKAEFMVERVLIRPLGYDSLYYITWQEIDHERVRTYIALYQKNNDNPRWKHVFNVPNPGKSAIDSAYVYVTALGLAGKIELGSGKFLWKYDSLFNPLAHSFQDFEPVIVKNEEVLFIDLPIEGRRTKRDTLRVHPQTGERIK
jgi:hypothetical protein